MSPLITILVLVLIFALIWYLISITPLPPPMANIRWVFYAVLVIIAIIVLLQKLGIVL